MSLNLTPMIDVVFLLLCFFLTASRFSKPEGVFPADFPGKGRAMAGSVPRMPIRIRLAIEADQPSGCRVTIDRLSETPLALSTLAERLRKIQSEIPGYDAETPVHLLAADNVAWDHVVNAYNAAIAAHYEKVFFASLP